jgi:hypothetical protein
VWENGDLGRIPQSTDVAFYSHTHVTHTPLYIVLLFLGLETTTTPVDLVSMLLHLQKYDLLINVLHV